MTKNPHGMLAPPGPSFPQILRYWKLLIKGDVDAVAPALFDAYGPIAGVDVTTGNSARILTKLRLHSKSRPYVLMVGPEANRFLMTSSPELIQRAPIVPDHVETADGDFAYWPSLASMDGELHRLHKKLVMTAFQPERLAGYLPMIREVVEKRVRFWDKQIDLHKEMSELALELLARTMLGFVPQSVGYIDFVTHLKQLIFQDTYSTELMHAKEQIWLVIRKLISTRRQVFTGDALSILVASGTQHVGSQIEDEDLLHYSYMLMDFGPTDIAIFLTYSIAVLALRRDLLRRLHEEHLHFSPEAVLKPDENLPFTINLLREIERLYPPVRSISRCAADDLTFEGYHIRRGTWLTCSLFLTHRLNSLFADPLEFDPDRFAPPRAEHKTPFALMGFGGGHHMCVAKHFTQIIACTVLHHLVESFDIEMLGQQVIPDIIYKGDLQQPRDTIVMRVRRL